jgi:hypothetical protein
MSINFLELFNAVAEVARPIHVKYTPVPDMTSPIADFGMDSLDMLMVCVYMCELHGIPEEVGKDLQATNVQEFQEFIDKHKTQDPESIEAAVEYCK